MAVTVIGGKMDMELTVRGIEPRLYVVSMKVL